jgi:heterogeneous nuclear ribonucleoprotein F/H
MNGLYNGNNFIVRLRGLPWNSTQNDVQNFLQGCKIHQTQFLTNDQGRATGECFVVLETKEDIEIAKNFDKKTMGTRYIEVFESNSEAMSETTKNTNTNDSSNQQNNDDWQEPVVRLRGLPYNSSKDDVIKFFDGLDIAQNGVHISSSKPAGEAFVAFMNMDNALRALEFNRMNMGHRYIEVFKSTYAEARASIMVDTQSMARQKGNNAPQRQGSYTGNNTTMNAGNNYNNNNINQFDTAPPPPPPSINYDTYSGNGNNYSMNNNNNSGSGSVKRSMTTSFTMKMRGVPFEAG